MSQENVDLDPVAPLERVRREIAERERHDVVLDELPDVAGDLGVLQVAGP
jgi:hypothetical protein